MAIFEPAGACEVRAAKKTVPLPAIMLEYMMETGSAAPAALALFALIAYGRYVLNQHGDNATRSAILDDSS
jgi:hypothetical protein